MTDEGNWFDVLFTNDPEVIAANVAEAARVAKLEQDYRDAESARLAAAKAEKARNRCPRCAGTGNLPQFQHRKGGECFTCSGSGVFYRT